MERKILCILTSVSTDPPAPSLDAGQTRENFSEIFEDQNSEL